MGSLDIDWQALVGRAGKIGVGLGDCGRGQTWRVESAICMPQTCLVRYGRVNLSDEHG
jgi:hypothetical protein